MDKALISRRFAKAVGTYLDKADVQRYVASWMAELTGRYIPSTYRNGYWKLAAARVCSHGCTCSRLHRRNVAERPLSGGGTLPGRCAG